MVMLAGTINMQDMRYLNLFRKITGVNTRHVLKYNNGLIFCVPKKFLSKAIGKNARNLRKMSDIVRKRIKVIPMPKGIENVKEFIGAIVNPIQFKDLEVKENEIILTAGKQSKAALIGRNKRRLEEMREIISNFFNKGFRII